MIDWRQHFDHVFCMHYSGYQDRFPRIVEQLRRVGLYPSEVFSFHNTISSVFVDRLMSVSNLNPVYGQYWKKPGYFNCQFNHYWILRESLLAGYRRILVIEDDVVFLKDMGLFEDIMSESPQDADLVLYDYWLYFKKNADEPGPYSRMTNSGEVYHSSSMYSMNQKFMNAYAECFDRSFMAFDDLWNSFDKRAFICYRANVHPGVQKAYDFAMTAAKGTENQYRDMGVDLGKYY